MTKVEEKMPMQQAGLIRYFDTENKGFQIKPEHVVAFAVIMSALVISLKLLV